MPTQITKSIVCLWTVCGGLSLIAFWSRRQSTVEANARTLARLDAAAEELGMSGPNVVMGPYPAYDHCGYRVAIAMVKESLKPGRYTDHLQYDSIRPMRAAHGNLVRAGLEANLRHWSVGDSAGKGY